MNMKTPNSSSRNENLLSLSLSLDDTMIREPVREIKRPETRGKLEEELSSFTPFSISRRKSYILSAPRVLYSIKGSSPKGESDLTFS
jgi:hypothetical protein